VPQKLGKLAFSHEIIHQIGGEDDTNSNTTKRILLLLESAPIGRHDASDRVLDSVLSRYILETPVAPEQMQDEVDKAAFALALVADARLATTHRKARLQLSPNRTFNRA